MADGGWRMADGDWPSWFAAAARPDVDAALRSFYADLDHDVAQGNAKCDQSGRCCHFDAFGHRLYVTALEVAWFVSHVGCGMADGGCEENRGDARRLPVLHIRHPTSDIPHLPACPYQIAGLCSQHAIRPLGCRVFFCQPGTEDWQHDLYERYLARLKSLHAQFDAPYRYLEWRAGLAEAHNARQLPLLGDPEDPPSGDGGRCG